MGAWVYQKPKQLKRLGPKAASFYVGWLDPDGKRRCKSCGPGSRGQKAAERLARKIEGQLLSGTYQGESKATWKQFREEHEARTLAILGVRNRQETVHALKQFERIVRPVRMQAVTTRSIAEYVSKRRHGRGLRKGTLVSPATINKELRCLRAVMRKAYKWGYLPKLLDFEFLKEMKKLPTYVSPEDFVRLYLACKHASMPDDLPYAAADWWRSLLVTAYMTGWRVGALLALRRDDVDLTEGVALTRAEDNKGKRDQKIVLHPLVIEHLQKIPSFDTVFFPWNQSRRMLWEELKRIQHPEGIKAIGKDHYTFHDLRRGFATMNADRITGDALQALMQHQDYKTTQRYINMARQLKPAAQNLFVPDLPKEEKAEGA